MTLGLFERSRKQGAALLGALGNVLAPNVMAAQRWLTDLRTPRPAIRLDGGSSIAFGDTPRWERFGHAPDAPTLVARINSSVIRGWRDGKFEVATCAALSALVRSSTCDEACVDIRQIDALNASKSDLHAYQSLDDMADASCEALLRDRSYAQLDALMAHRESRIFHQAGDTLYQQAWNPRVVLMNDGGSHHFVAARRLAGMLGESVEVTAKATIHRLDPTAVASMAASYEVFAVDRAVVDGPVHEAAMAMGAAYYTRHLPIPLAKDVAVFLPKDDPRSMRIAAALREGGATDVNAHLASCLALQRANEQKPGVLLDDGNQHRLRPSCR